MNAVELEHDLNESCHLNNRTSRDIKQLLNNSYNDVNKKCGFWSWLNGNPQERAVLATQEAKARILSVMDSEELFARLPSLMAYCGKALGPGDQRVQHAHHVLSQAARRHSQHEATTNRATRSHCQQDQGNTKEQGRTYNATFRMNDLERATIASLIRDADAAVDNKYAQFLALRNRILLLSASAMFVLILIIAAAGTWHWQLTPTASVSVNDKVAKWTDTPIPAGARAFVAVALLGCVGAFLSGIRSVSRIDANPYHFRVSWWQSWLKLPVGALSAIVGVFALQSRAFPAVPATSWVELLMWAVAFGAAQQAITRFVDMRVQSLAGDDHQDDDSTTRASSLQPLPRRAAQDDDSTSTTPELSQRVGAAA